MSMTDGLDDGSKPAIHHPEHKIIPATFSRKEPREQVTTAFISREGMIFKQKLQLALECKTLEMGKTLISSVIS